MKFKRTTALLWMLSLPTLTLLAPQTEVRADKANQTFTPATTTAPAVAADDTSPLRRALLARLEFEELGLQMFGHVATHQGQTACFIKHPGSTNQMVYKIGDVIGGYRITAIDEQQVTFERNGSKFWLTSGDQAKDEAEAEGFYHAEEETLIAAAPGVQEPLPQGDDGSEISNEASSLQYKVKAATEGLKFKTQRFASAEVVEEGGNTKFREVAPAVTRTADRLFAKPVDGHLTSAFGYRRHPMGGLGKRFHQGIDIGAKYGEHVGSIADGVVTRVRYSGTMGRYVTIRHANGYESRYGHLSRQSVKEGDKVKQGEEIGRVGSTGRSTGPHLHLELRRNGTLIDPGPVMKYRR